MITVERAFRARKFLYLHLAECINNGKKIPTYATLTQIVAKQITGREVEPNSGTTSANFNWLENNNFLTRSKIRKINKYNFILLPIPEEYKGQFSAEEGALIEEALSKQSSSTKVVGITQSARSKQKRASVREGQKVFSVDTSLKKKQKQSQQSNDNNNKMTAQQDSYSQYIDKLLSEVRHPRRSNGNAHFKLALMHFKDWGYLKEEFHIRIPFPKTRSLLQEDFVNGLLWLNDAASFNCRYVMLYLERLWDVIFYKLTGKLISEESTRIQLLKNNGCDVLENLLQSKTTYPNQDLFPSIVEKDMRETERTTQLIMSLSNNLNA